MRSTAQKRTYTIVVTPDEDEGGFVGRCDELHANSQGNTYGEVMENMKEAVELAVEEIDSTIGFNVLIVEK